MQEKGRGMGLSDEKINLSFGKEFGKAGREKGSRSREKKTLSPIVRRRNRLFREEASDPAYN